MQFCTYICHIRIYRPSLINSNKWGNKKEGKRIETSVKVESRRKRNLARFFFFSRQHLHFMSDKTMHST